MTGTHIAGIIALVYLAIGIYSFFWIKNDAEFRVGPWVPVAILSIFFWPVMVLVWVIIRGPEHLSSIAAKQSHRDYQIYMRTKKDKDLFVNLPKADSNKRDVSRETMRPATENKNDTGVYKDFNLEKLIEEGKWIEAAAVAKQMHKVCIQAQDEDQACKYEEYIRRIEDAKRMEAD